MNRLANLLSIRRGEGRMAVLVMGVMLSTAAGETLGSTGIEALFFARFGTQYLPYMYMGLGITAILTSFGITAVLGRLRRELLYMAMPAVLAMILIAGRIALLSHFNWMYPVLWLGKEIVNSLVGLLVWGIAGIVCDTRQAKRLFPLFNASRILGSVIGGLITGLLVAWLGSENLLLAWAIILVTAFFLSRALLQNNGQIASPSRHKPPSVIAEIRRGYQYVRKSNLLIWISAATVLFSVLYFSIALPFSQAATERFVNEDALASFLGLFNGVTTAAAFIASLFLANRLMARFGIMACLLIFTGIYFLGFGLLALYPIFVLILAFRFTQVLWLSGVADPAYQAVFNVVPPERRDQVRNFINGVPSQAGTFIAGFVLLIGEHTLSPQQLYWIGFGAAALCIYTIWEARRGYNLALVEALRAGRPHIFFSEDQPFGGFRQDALAVQTVIHGMENPDPATRRVAAEILGHIATDDATRVLINGLRDSDTSVRAACLRGLSRGAAESAQSEIIACLRDTDSEVRIEAVSVFARSADSSHLINFLPALMNDPDSRVGIRAAVEILRAPIDDKVQTEARKFLRNKAERGGTDERVQALTAFGKVSDEDTFEFLKEQLEDASTPIAVRRAAIPALARANETESIPALIAALGDSNFSIVETAAKALGEIGQAALEPLTNALNDSHHARGALLALQQLDTRSSAQSIHKFAFDSKELALHYAKLGSDFKQDNQPAKMLLADSLHSKAREHSLRALEAISLLGEHEALLLSIENLQSKDSTQRANAFETLDSVGAGWREIIQPLTALWDESNENDSPAKLDSRIEVVNLTTLLNDSDDWLRACAAYAAQHESSLSTTLKQLAESDSNAFVRETARGGTMDTLVTLSMMDRILFLRRVPLFAELSPADLKQVAAIAEEILFTDGDALAHQGESGDAMFIIASGEVKVTAARDQVEVELARRKPGEYVGEMSIISREPRIATLKAIGEVRVLCIDQKSFEGLLRERPDVSLAVMQVLCARLKEAGNKIEGYNSAHNN